MKSIGIEMNSVKWTQDDIKKHGRKQLSLEERNHYPYIHSEKYDSQIFWNSPLHTNQCNQWYNLTKIQLGSNITEIPQETFMRLGVFTIVQGTRYDLKIDAKFKVSVFERKTASILSTPFEFQQKNK